MYKLSIVITNYNYGRFVAAAIKSALGIRCPSIEVIVVDDGSTDDSRAILESYDSRVRSIFIQNSGQRVAANHGFAASTGDVVIFLDADDLLPPDVGERIADVQWLKFSKVQFSMQRISSTGQVIGKLFPEWVSTPSPREVRHWAERTSAYPTPPGSGNAYARSFLSQVMPLGPQLGDAADSGLLAAAPFLGDVVTIPDVVVGYRRHGQNDSNLLLDPSRFSREVARARDRWDFAKRYRSGTAGRAGDSAALFRSRELLQLRVAGWRMTGGQTVLDGDGWGRLIYDACRAPIHPGPERFRRRAVITAWCLATLLSPSPVGRALVRKRYAR